MKQNWLKHLNEQQHKAVTFGEGPLLVVAGAGSGKTRTLAYRVAHLIERGVPPERILLLTFTRRAAREMLSRAAEALGKEAGVTGRVWGGTFHATANRLLRIYHQAAGLSQEFTILDQSDAQDMLDVIRHRTLEKMQKKKRFPRKGTLLAIYSRKMNSGESLEYVLKTQFPWCEKYKSQLKEIFREYVSVKQKRGTLDYDDLLFYWFHLLEDPKASRAIEERFDYILVDEYQDTNRMQSGILSRMRQKNRNIMAVGDDAQSIYSFRSATVRNMLDFPDVFPDTTIITLEQNYRSTETILDTTNRLISQARERFSKNLFSTRRALSRPRLITCTDEECEAETVIKQVIEHYEEGVALQKQAVLFRAGSHSAALEIALMKENIPFHKFGGLKFLEAAHVKDFIAYVRIVENPKDEIAWFRVLQLFEGVGPATASAFFEHLTQNSYRLDSLKTARVSPPVFKNLSRLHKLYCESIASETELSSQLDAIARFYKPLLEDNHENPQVRYNDIEHIIQLASGSKSRSQFLADLILDPPASTSDLAGPPKKDEDFLTLSTIHSAKGCEWDVVYLIHAADGCLPSDMSTESEKQVEEELRLAYVAMTRAKDHLYVTWPLRFYSRPGGMSDRHAYSQCSRFFTPEVMETMENVALEEKKETDEASGIEAATDIGQKMKDMWD